MKKLQIKTWLICIFACTWASVCSQTSPQDAIRELNNQGKASFRKGMYSEAESSFLKALEMHGQSVRQETAAYVESLNGLARIYHKKGLYQQADSLLHKALSLQDGAPEQTGLEYAETLHDLAKLNMERQQYAGVEDLLNEAIEIRKNRLGETHIDYAESVHALGYYYLFLGILDKAESLLNEAAGIRLKTSGELSLEYANSMLAAGTLYLMKSDFVLSDEKYKHSMEIIRTLVGENHPDYAETLLSYSILETTVGKYGEAEKSLAEVCAITERHYDRKHPHYAVALSTLGAVYVQQSEFKKAEPVLLESLLLIKEIMGEMHNYYYSALNSLAYLYQLCGLDEKAEPYLIQSLNIRKEMFGEHHLSVANALNALSNYYQNMSNYDRAENLLLQAIGISKSITGDTTLQYATQLSNLSVIYDKKAEFDTSLEYSEKTLAILKNKLDDSHPDYLTALENHASTFLSKSKALKDTALLSAVAYNNKTVEELFLEICEKRKAAPGENRPAYARSLNHLAYCYYRTGQPEKAETTYKNALSVFNEQHPYRLAILSNLGILQHRSANIPLAADYYMQTFQLIRNQIEQKLLFLSEKEQTLYWNSLINHAGFFKTFLYRYHDSLPSFAGFIHNYELFSKSLLLNSARLIRQSITDNGGGEALRLLKSVDEAIVNLENEIIKQFGVGSSADIHHFLVNSGDEQLIQLADYLNSQKEFVSREEKNLVRDYGVYNRYRTAFSMEWQEIQSVLNSNEAAIEFLSFDYIDVEKIDITDTLYCALLLRAGDPYPRMIPLCNARELQAALHRSKNDPAALFPVIWAPVEKYLTDAAHVYIAPTGLLHSASFAGIQKENRYLCDDYTIHHLLSTKDIVRLKEPEKKTHPAGYAVLFGGADFGVSPDEMEEFYSGQDAFVPTNLNRNMLDYMDPSRGQGFAYLSGSKTEVQNIERLLSENSWKTMLFTDLEANETQFKSFSAKDEICSPLLIHLSTHGFYLPLRRSNTGDIHPLPATDADRTIYRLSDNPLIRSGLALTGANHVWRGGDPVQGVDDGILTAYEISNMNLSHTELVVLSACHTGLGDINDSEGVFGLQRAFRLAGVETMIVSLWEAPDRETVELMTDFYKLWTQGLDKKQAFTKAQLNMRQSYPDHPEKWAGFIMIE